MTTDADVVVIGGGISGLTAAWRLVQAGRSVAVLEAHDRVGGRTWSRELRPGVIAELGGTWVGPTQDRVLALLDELGIATFPQYNEGRAVYWARGRHHTFSDKTPVGALPPDWRLLPSLAWLTLRLNRMAATLPPGAPWAAADARAWDAETFDSFVRRNTMGATAPRVTHAALHALFGADLRELSLLAVLHLIRGAGNADQPGRFERLLETRNGAQERRIRGGAQQISLQLAERLGDAVRREHAVRSIEQDDLQVQVTCRNGAVVKARRVIVAIPPCQAARIDVEPALPVPRQQLQRRYPLGHLMKVEALYAAPFWRAAGLSGAAVLDAGPARSMFDVSPEDARAGVLLGFVGGGEAQAYMGRFDALRADFLRDAVHCFGALAGQPDEVLIQDWAQERWIGGGPVSFGPPGVLTAFGPALCAPVGRLHWAGTETADYWSGYMDGAVRAGEAAAVAVAGLIH